MINKQYQQKLSYQQKSLQDKQINSMVQKNLLERDCGSVVPRKIDRAHLLVLPDVDDSARLERTEVLDARKRKVTEQFLLILAHEGRHLHTLLTRGEDVVDAPLLRHREAHRPAEADEVLAGASTAGRSSILEHTGHNRSQPVLVVTVALNHGHLAVAGHLRVEGKLSGDEALVVLHLADLDQVRDLDLRRKCVTKGSFCIKQQSCQCQYCVSIHCANIKSGLRVTLTVCSQPHLLTIFKNFWFHACQNLSSMN